MDAIYLSPRKILSYLKNLEDKVPVINRHAYQITSKSEFKNNADLDEEAQSILKYVGLTECVPTCKFDKTEDNVAGYTINDYSIYHIPITVSEKYRYNSVACRAILAHEICHKVIYLNGINFTGPQEINEIYTDLCTIYIGLGKLVLQGYIDSKTNELKMGYLKLDMYRQTFTIVALTTKMYGSIDQNQLALLNEVYLEEAISQWDSIDILKKKLKDTFFNEEEALSIVNRNILILKQILDIVFTKHGEIFRKKSKEAETLGLFGELNEKKPLALFSMLYESLFDHTESEKFSTAQKEISNLILALTDEYKDIAFGSLSYSKLKCPNCGCESTTNIEDRDTIIKCPSCRIYFRFCNTHLNITSMRQIRAREISEKEKEIIAIEEAKQKNEKDKKTLADRYATLEIELSGEYQKGYQQGWNAGLAQTTKSMNQQYTATIDKLPKWLKFLIGNRLPKEI